MSQQINLFNPIFLKQKKYFSATAMAQALGLILIGSVLALAYAYYQTSNLSREAIAVAAQLNASQARLVTVNAEYGLRPKSKSLEDEIQKTEAETKALQQVFDILQKGEFGNTKGYADYFRAFSRQIVDGLWITGFNILGAGNEIGLQGRALQAEAVPVYINRLKREPVMLGKSFATLEMQVPLVEQPKSGPSNDTQLAPAAYIEFNLQSSALTKEQADSSKAKNK